MLNLKKTQQPKYNIYPSILDAFAWYKRSENPESKQELIDKINRVPFESEAADKGTAFNELVDDFGVLKVVRTNKGTIKYNGFEFKEDIVLAFKDQVSGAIPQQRVEATIETESGIVFLYGYSDEILGDTCIDIKTTSNYDFPKYLHNWQHVIYPYCLNEMGVECNNFSYLVTDFNNIFKEDYAYHSDCLSKLKQELVEFIFFLEMNRDKITDKKIFNEEDYYTEQMYHDELDKRVVA